MSSYDEAVELMRCVDEPKWTTGRVPDSIAPLLRALADLAQQRGKGLPFDKLQATVQEKTGQRKGRNVIRRWIVEAGGEPWFRS